MLWTKWMIRFPAVEFEVQEGMIIFFAGLGALEAKDI